MNKYVVMYRFIDRLEKERYRNIIVTAKNIYEAVQIVKSMRIPTEDIVQVELV